MHPRTEGEPARAARSSNRHSLLVRKTDAIIGRRRTRLMMADSADQLRELIDAIPTISWCGLPDGSIQFVNRRWTLYTGLSLDVSKGQWQVAIHPDDLPALIDRWKVIRGTGECLGVEARIRRHDGEYRWFLFHTQSVRDAAGEIVRWYGSAT